MGLGECLTDSLELQCIYFLHYIAPLSAFYCLTTIVVQSSKVRIPLLLECWAVLETLFLLLVSYPRHWTLQHAAIHPELISPQRRRKLFNMCMSTIQDPERYLQKWFRGASLSEIRRDNVKELYCWAFLQKGKYGPEDEEELEQYATKTESLLGRELEPGRGNAVSLRVTLDSVKAFHRSL